MAEEIGLRVDEAGFNDMVEEAKKVHSLKWFWRFASVEGCELHLY